MDLIIELGGEIKKFNQTVKREIRIFRNSYNEIFAETGEKSSRILEHIIELFDFSEELSRLLLDCKFLELAEYSDLTDRDVDFEYERINCVFEKIKIRYSKSRAEYVNSLKISLHKTDE